MMTQDDFLKIADSLKQAETDDTPYLVVKDNDVAVVGNANKTELKKNNYVLKFRFPITDDKFKTEESIIVGDSYITPISFDNVYISPRKDLQVVNAVMTIMAFYNKVYPDGAVENRSPEELYEIFLNLDDQFLDAAYTFVAIALNVDDKLVENLLPSSVLKVTAEILRDHPEIVNEADAFFG